MFGILVFISWINNVYFLYVLIVFFFFKQKTAYEMRISDWSSDVCSSDLLSTLDLAKGLIDEGFHPMTMYFPLVVHGAMLVEPTETESKAALDQFIGAMRSVAERAKAGDP